DRAHRHPSGVHRSPGRSRGHGASGDVRPMIAISIAAIFLALLILNLLVLPGQRVSKRRLGIERAPFSPGRSVAGFLERRGWDQGIAQALSLASINTEPGLFVLRV